MTSDAPRDAPKDTPRASPRAALRKRISPGSPDPVLPVLPLRDIVVFPHMVVPLFVGREKSVLALDDADKNIRILSDSGRIIQAPDIVARPARDSGDTDDDGGSDPHIILVSQKDAACENPTPKDLYTVGTIASIIQPLKLPDGTVKVLVEGRARCRVTGLTENNGFLEAHAEPVADAIADETEIEALARSVIAQFEVYVKINKKLSAEILGSVCQIDDFAKLADTAACHLNIKLSRKQELLETVSVRERLEKVYSLMENEINVLQVERKIRGRVKQQMEKTQREYYLNEQLKAIQKELGDGGDTRDDFSELEKKIKKTKFTKEARERAVAELKKLRQMSPMSAEATVVRNYLDWLLAIPWGTRGKTRNDLLKAEEILNEDHHGLEKVKERILEYLAVQQRTNKMKGPILCLVGPPGVGKTSLGKSIARATGRDFVRMSLGGIRDEAEIRGHRRTYIGSMPGRVIQSMKKVKHTNPLFLLDEVDKMGADFRGDPSAALLEVLDPEQNAAFSDHYLEVDYDLGNVMFITTANTLDIPLPLMDRMEIIRIAGYTEDEKIQIARRHLIPKALESHGLKDGEWSLDDDSLRELIRIYTREAGVRNLEREINNLARKAVKKILTAGVKNIVINPDVLEKYAGVPKFRHGEVEQEDQVGIVTGLAWTEMGGELLTIEGIMLPGKGKMVVTGNLKEVMKESITAANSYVKARAAELGIEPPMFERKDIHVHVPEAATPKDGPSAGVAMATAIVSVMTRIPVHRNVAMTGEITLRGRILPVGGLKEKLLAALRGGVSRVLIPADNARQLAEIPDNVKEGMNIIPVANMDEVIANALVEIPQAISWDQDYAPAPDSPSAEGSESIIAH